MNERTNERTVLPTYSKHNLVEWFLLQIRVQQTMADALIFFVLSHRRTQKSVIAIEATFLTLTTPVAMNVSKRLLQIS